jgi:hypothetical protein
MIYSLLNYTRGELEIGILNSFTEQQQQQQHGLSLQERNVKAGGTFLFFELAPASRPCSTGKLSAQCIYSGPPELIIENFAKQIF